MVNLRSSSNYFKLRKSGVHSKALYLTENSLITGSEICYTNLGGLITNNEPIRMSLPYVEPCGGAPRHLFGTFQSSVGWRS